MDERLTAALARGNYQITAFEQRQNFKIRVKLMLMHSVNGGLFKITLDLITFVDLLIRRGKTEIILLDSRDNPIKITDLSTFLDQLLEIYQEATNEYHLEYEEFKKKRTVVSLVDLK